MNCQKIFEKKGPQSSNFVFSFLYVSLLQHKDTVVHYSSLNRH